MVHRILRLQNSHTYAAPVSGGNSTPLPHAAANAGEAYQEMLRQLTEQADALQKETNSTPPPSSNGAAPDNGIVDNSGAMVMPIGFYTSDQRKGHQKELFKQQLEVFKQALVKNSPQYCDRYTIAHRNEKNGQIQHLDLGTVSNRVDIYIGRIQRSLENNNMVTIPNQIQKLRYWISRKEELVGKIRQSEI